MKRKTIRNHKDFITSRQDIGARTDFFIVKIKPAKFPQDPRYGIIISKRILKGAVERNRAKRLMRDWICFNENLMIDKYDYIFILNGTILGASRETGRTETSCALKSIIKKENANSK